MTNTTNEIFSGKHEEFSVLVPEDSKSFTMTADNRSLLIVAVAGLVVAAIALILSIVAISQNGGIDVLLPETSSSTDSTDSKASISSSYDEDKIWQLAFENQGRGSYIDEATGELRGFHVDLASAVCQIAGVSCEMVFDTPTRCWDSQTGGRPQGGEGLFNQYYDACVGWIHTFERPRTFKFTDPHSVPIAAKFIVKKGNTAFDWTDLTGTKIGLIDGYAYDEHCIAREKDTITGYKLSPDQIVHYDGRETLHQGLLDEEVDAVFDYENSWVALDNETMKASDPVTSCFVAGSALMMRKDNRLDSWWNPALATVIEDKTRWRAICNDLRDEHGHIAGPEPEDVCLNYPA